MRYPPLKLKAISMNVNFNLDALMKYDLYFSTNKFAVGKVLPQHKNSDSSRSISTLILWTSPSVLTESAFPYLLRYLPISLSFPSPFQGRRRSYFAGCRKRDVSAHCIDDACSVIGRILPRGGTLVEGPSIIRTDASARALRKPFFSRDYR